MIFKKLTFLEKVLKNYKENKPISNIVKGMFKDETSESLSKRFKEAKEKNGLD